MKINLLLLSVALGVVLDVALGVALAAGGVAVQVQEPSHADTESCTHAAIPPLEGRTSFRVTLAFGASPSNSLSAAAGVDADGDGRLSLREQAMEFGWDGDALFLRKQGAFGWERIGFPGAEGPCVLEAEVSLHGDARDRRLRLSANGSRLCAVPAKDWLPREALEGGLVRVTARGTGVDGTAEVTPVTDGSLILLR